MNEISLGTSAKVDGGYFEQIKEAKLSSRIDESNFEYPLFVSQALACPDEYLLQLLKIGTTDIG